MRHEANKLRGLTKTGLAAGMHWLGIDSLVGTRRGLRDIPLILTWHRVVEDFEKASETAIPPMLVEARTLERQLDWIGQRYDFVSLDEVADLLESGRRPSRPVAALTFDDGYADVYHNGFPLLRRKGIPFAFFVVTDLVGSQRLQIHDELYLLFSRAMEQWPAPRQALADRLGSLSLDGLPVQGLEAACGDPFRLTRLLLEHLRREELERVAAALRDGVKVDEASLEQLRAADWDMLREMRDGGVLIGSHTRTHKLLAHESPTTVLDELCLSREELERELGIPPRHFAYPDGRFNLDNVRAVARAGYDYAYTVCMHQDQASPMLTIPRRVLWEKSCMDPFGRFSGSIMSCQINGIFDPSSRCDQQHWPGEVASAG